MMNVKRTPFFEILADALRHKDDAREDPVEDCRRVEGCFEVPLCKKELKPAESKV